MQLYKKMFSLLGKKNMRKIDDVDEAIRWYLNAKCYCGVNPFLFALWCASHSQKNSDAEANGNSMLIIITIR